MDTISEIEWAQLAAFVDGEGHVAITCSRVNPRQTRTSLWYHPRMLVYNSDRRLMDWLQEKFGGSWRNYRKKPAKAHYKPSLVWELSGTKLLPALRRLRPYFILKAEQADLVLSFYDDAVWHKGGNYGDPAKRRISAAELARRHGLYADSLRLNHRGPDAS